MNRALLIKIVVAVGLLLAVAIGVSILGGSEELLRDLAARESELRGYRDGYPILVFAVAFLFYVVVTGLSLPGAAALSLVYGWYFGFLPGLILVSFASTAGATVAFLLSRYLFRDAIEARFDKSLENFQQNLKREGAYYLFTLRLIPAVPFFLINAVMGLTPMRVWTFWWVSQLGMLPGTIVYLYAGSRVPGLKDLAERGLGGIFDWQLILAFVLLGAFPLIARKVVGVWRSPRALARDAAAESPAEPRQAAPATDAENPDRDD